MVPGKLFLSRFLSVNGHQVFMCGHIDPDKKRFNYQYHRLYQNGIVLANKLKE
jgi:hypothetical protein